MLAGGGVYDHLDFSFTPDRPDGSAVPLPPDTPGGGGAALRRQLRILKEFIEGFDFIRMAPNNGILRKSQVTGPPAGGAPLMDKATVRALADVGNAYAVYVQGGTQAELELELPANNYKADWVNTKTGQVEKSETFHHASGPRTFTSPAYAEDVALRVTRQRGVAQVEETRPKQFPHRVWAACDFESRTPDYGWFGPAERNVLPRYPGNTTALAVGERPYQNFSAIMTGINPVPGPRLGKVNYLYLRYYLVGSTEATFQHFSLTSNDNNHLRMRGLTEGKWAEVTLNFTRDAQRNDGTPGIPFQEGERMDDLKIFVGKPGDGQRYDLVIDDVIFFANDPALPPEPEPFPNRVIFLAGFDTGPKEKYWPGEFEMVEKGLPADSYWRVARAVPRQAGSGKWIRLQIDPVRAVGAHTKLRFRYHLTGSRRMTVQIFDLTDKDNRHIHLRDLQLGRWQTLYLDFTKEARRNDGSDTPFAAGHQVDDLFFFVQPDGPEPLDLFIDEVVLFDAGQRAEESK
jgi:hypothetical protein